MVEFIYFRVSYTAIMIRIIFGLFRPCRTWKGGSWRIDTFIGGWQERIFNILVHVYLFRTNLEPESTLRPGLQIVGTAGTAGTGKLSDLTIWRKEVSIHFWREIRDLFLLWYGEAKYILQPWLLYCFIFLNKNRKFVTILRLKTTSWDALTSIEDTPHTHRHTHTFIPARNV